MTKYQHGKRNNEPNLMGLAIVVLLSIVIGAFLALEFIQHYPSASVFAKPVKQSPESVYVDCKTVWRVPCQLKEYPKLHNTTHVEAVTTGEKIQHVMGYRKFQASEVPVQ